MNNKTTEQKVENIGIYFSEISQSFIKEYEKKGLKKHTKIIFDFFKEIDLKNYKILELGCGLGGLLLEFLELGVKHAYGVDLSEKMIENAKVYAESKNFTNKTDFFVGDFNSVRKDLLPIDQADIVVADRVLCCTPVPLEILQNMISFDPEFLVVIQPRKNYVFRAHMSLRIKYRQFKLRVKNHGTSIPFVTIKEYGKLCGDSGYKRVLQKYRFGWEVVIYQKV